MTNISIDPLFIGLTKPPMTMGVPLQFFGLNFILSACGFILFTSLFSKFLVVMVFSLPIHAIGYLATRKDPHWMDIWHKKMAQTGPIRNHRYWKSNSYKP